MKRMIAYAMQHESASGLCLMAAAFVALVLANSPLSDPYSDFFAAPLRVGLTIHGIFYGLEENVAAWINDLLMAVFFLLLGIEIKREVLIGALSDRGAALQPVFAVVCGMLAPIAVYIARHHGNPVLLHAWAVPVSTDIAFALAVATLAGPRVPPSIKVLLMAIAVLDDLLAILILAIFYAGALHAAYLAIAVVGFIGLVSLNRFNTRHLGAYIGCGALVWLGFMETGLHPTLAGVITALFVPLSSNEETTAPATRLEGILHPIVAFGVLPLFTLANAGLRLGGIAIGDFARPLTLSVLACLCLAKPLGIMTGLLGGHYTGVARKPDDTPWRHYFGIAVLCGMGFTMPLFLADVAFDNRALIEQVKLGVLSACLLSGVIGWSICRLIFKPKGSRHV